MSSPPLYECTGCGFRRETTWNPGLCPACLRRWNIRTMRVATERGPAVDDGEVVSLSDVDVTEVPRIQIGGPFASIDRILGGGIVDGRAVYLLAGAAGIGKSSLLMQSMQQLAQQGLVVLYATAEESVRQVRLRSKRFGEFNPRLLIVRESDLENILAHAADHEAKVLVIDSLNTLVVRSPATGEEYEVGSAGAVSTAARMIVDFATEEDIPVFVVNHVTKAGIAAGPNSAAHAADVVLFFEGVEGEAERSVSIPSKSRFGPIGGRAVFTMGQAGLSPVEAGSGASE